MSNSNCGGNVVSLTEHKQQVEKLKQDYEDLYNDLIASGKTESDALAIVRHIESQQEDYFNSIQDDVMQIRKHFTISWLEDHFKWSGLKNQQKKDLLWQLGMNVKGGKKWYLRDERVRNEDGKDGNTARVQPIVYGQERLDDEWINLRFADFSKVASEEAQDWRRRKNGGSLKIKGRK